MFGSSVGWQLGTRLGTFAASSRPVQRLREWPVASQQQARRNALVASTACAQRRAERQDVADFFEALTHPADQVIVAPVRRHG